MGMRNVGRRVAVVGAGMTKFVRRAQETGKELSFEATKMALESCDLDIGPGRLRGPWHRP